MKSKKEIEAENAALVERGLKPIPGHLCEKVSELRRAGLPHNDAVDCAEHQHAEDAKQEAAKECRHSSERQALLEIQVQARVLLDTVTSAIGRGGANS